MYTNKIPLTLLFCMMLNISSNFAKPVPDDGGDDSEINIGIDAERIGTYVDGSWKDKYEDELDGYDSKQKDDCHSFGSKNGCSYKRSSSIGSDALGHKSNTNAVAGVGYEHENQKVYGAEATHNGNIAIGESNIKYGVEAGSGASYDETYLGGSIGSKVEASGSVGGFGVDVGAGIGVGLGADVGYNSHEKSVALVATTPVGEYGATIGCKTKVCFVGCVSVTFCWVCALTKYLHNLLCYRKCIDQG